MKIFYVALLFCMNVAYTQTLQKKVPLLYEPFISVGYLNMSSNLPSEYNNVILNTYRLNGIPIPTQNQFGSTFSAKGGIYFSLSGIVYTGFALGYMYSGAHSAYKDLNVNGDIQSFSITLVSKAKLTNIYNYSLILFLEAGANYAASDIYERLNINEHPENNINNRWFVETWGPCMLAAMGTELNFGEITVSPQIGYNLALNMISSVIKEEIYIKDGTSWNSLKNIGQSGLIFLIKFGINFQKDRNS